MINYLKISTLLVFLCMGHMGMSQNILSLFKNSDFAAIEAKLSPEVKAKILSSKVTGKAETMSLLKKTLGEISPLTLSTNHTGSSGDAENYLITNLTTKDNKTMRLFIHLENGPNGKQICDIKLK